MDYSLCGVNGMGRPLCKLKKFQSKEIRNNEPETNKCNMG